jgi:hypothetical protein
VVVLEVRADGHPDIHYHLHQHASPAQVGLKNLTDRMHSLLLVEAVVEEVESWKT